MGELHKAEYVGRGADPHALSGCTSLAAPPCVHQTCSVRVWFCFEGPAHMHD